MDYVSLGSTGLRASVAGFGSGGFSRLGLGKGKSEAEAIALVHEALDLGINLIDTAANYGTEAVVGRAIASYPRDRLIISTKASINRKETLISAKEVVASLENSLRDLGTDYVDVLLLHGVPPSAYAHARDVIAPVMLREKDKGKLRHLGITELVSVDHEHRMLTQALTDKLWEVVMLGYHMLHQNAKRILFPAIREAGVGTLLMFAVRSIFSQPERLRAAMQDLGARGLLPDSIARSPDPLRFLLHASGASSVTDAAYRFVRHTVGVDVVLFGTSEPKHLRENIASLLKPPLPDADLETISALFGNLVGVGLDVPAQNPISTAAHRGTGISSS